MQFCLIGLAQDLYINTIRGLKEKNRHSESDGIPNLAKNGKKSENWPKRPTLTVPYLQGHGEQ